MQCTTRSRVVTERSRDCHLCGRMIGGEVPGRTVVFEDAQQLAGVGVRCRIGRLLLYIGEVRGLEAWCMEGRLALCGCMPGLDGLHGRAAETRGTSRSISVAVWS
jgi:hypothetical protein